MNELSIVPPNEPLSFKFGDDEIRVMRDEGAEPLFVASDVCKALGLSNPSVALAALPDDEKGIREVYTVRGMQNLLTVTESGMYRLVFRSNKPLAEKFRRWVLHEVLPAVRKSGSYSVQPQQSSNPSIQALRQIVDVIEQIDNRVALLEESAGWQADYYTVLGYFRKFKMVAPSTNERQSIGIRATKLSHERGRSIGKANDARWGEVNSYHVSILDEIVKR
jgi:prophage antirepressor-like protein